MNKLPIIEPITVSVGSEVKILKIDYINDYNPGDTLIVTWDGTDYECIAKGPNGMCSFIGNNIYHEGNECGEKIDTGEPFFIVRLFPNTFIISPEIKTIKFSIDKVIDIKNQEEYNDDLPQDFPRFTIKGESAIKSDMLITPYTANFNTGYIFITDYKGNVKWYKHIPSFGYNFKQHYNSNNELRYSYMVTERPLNGQYDMCHTNIMNDKMEIIDEDIRMLKHGTVKNQYPLECHTFTFLDDKHYIMTAVNTVKVKNIPGYENKYYYVINNIIQEQKDGEVVWHFETIDYPELYTASCKNNSFEDGTTDIGAADYAHINAISKDKNGDILVSFRNIGMVKINYKTKEIMWIMGRNRNDIVGLNIKDIPYLQHDVRYLADGSFTIFDNCGCPEDYSRVCRYWIDDEVKTLIEVKTYNSEFPRSIALGYSELIDEDNDVYDITYGFCPGAPALEEYDFKNNKSNFTLTFDKGANLYNINRALKNFEE